MIQSAYRYNTDIAVSTLAKASRACKVRSRLSLYVTEQLSPRRPKPKYSYRDTSEGLCGFCWGQYYIMWSYSYTFHPHTVRLQPWCKMRCCIFYKCNQETIIESENEVLELIGRVDEGVEEFFTKRVLPADTEWVSPVAFQCTPLCFVSWHCVYRVSVALKCLWCPHQNHSVIMAMLHIHETTTGYLMKQVILLLKLTSILSFLGHCLF